jgi:hypothetical protein
VTPFSARMAHSVLEDIQRGRRGTFDDSHSPSMRHAEGCNSNWGMGTRADTGIIDSVVTSSCLDPCVPLSKRNQHMLAYAVFDSSCKDLQGCICHDNIVRSNSQLECKVNKDPPCVGWRRLHARRWRTTAAHFDWCSLAVGTNMNYNSTGTGNCNVELGRTPQ